MAGGHLQIADRPQVLLKVESTTMGLWYHIMMCVFGEA